MDSEEARKATMRNGKVLKGARAAFRQTMREASQDQAKLWKLSTWANKKATGLIEP